MKKLLILPLLFLSFAHAETFQCKVVGVTDGDTITCLTEAKEQIKVRLYQIDAPELDQPYGEEAKQVLSSIIFDKTVIVVSKHNQNEKDIPASGIIIFGNYFLQDKSGTKIEGAAHFIVENLMLERGYAWYRQSSSFPKNREAWFNHFQEKYKVDICVDQFTLDGDRFNGEQLDGEELFFLSNYLHERKAKAAKRGLWADKHAVAPWEWRKEKSSSSNSKYINICGHFPTKQNPDGCRPMKRKEFEKIIEKAKTFDERVN